MIIVQQTQLLELDFRESPGSFKGSRPTVMQNSSLPVAQKYTSEFCAHVMGSLPLVVVIIIIHNFYIALFSALEQTHCPEYTSVLGSVL